MRGLRGCGWTRALRVAGIAAVAALALVIPAGSLGVHDLGLFELDTAAPGYANTADTSAPIDGNNAPYDWQSIFDATGQQTLTSVEEPRLLTADFSADSATPDTSYFASSNKDIDDVSTWQCGSVNNPTPKDEISNAYAALFRNTSNDHVVFYAGGERDKNNGNSFMGFWIFKSAVGCNSPGNFSGQHSNGDVLVLSNFTGGGTHPLVEVYQWMSGGLTLMSSGGFCHTVGVGDHVCGEVNGTPFKTTWAPHNADANPLDTNEFLEVGVDLTEVLKLDTGMVPCFARFQAETRSSQETTATLKDYAGGRFNTCTTDTASTPMSGGVSVSGSSVLPGAQVTDQAVVTGTALVGTPPAPTGSVSFFLCGPQATQALAVCSSGGTSVGTVNLSGSTNPATVTSPTVAPTAPGWYCFRAVYGGDANYPDESWDSGPGECFQLMKATPTVSTDIHAGPGADDAAGAPVITSAAIGSTVHDQATVSGSAGTPTGTVNFTVYSGNTVCSGTGAAAGTLTLSGGIAHPSADATVPVGGLSYKAHYHGSVVYDEADGPCEPLTASRLTPNVSTDIHNASHQVVTAVETGSTVHDFVGVTGSATMPSGLITVDWFTNGTCSGPAASNSGNVTLDASGHADVTGFPQGPLSAGLYGFRAHYAGDATYLPSDGACEPLHVVDADISISPNGVNRVGQQHTFTAHVDENDGAGSVNAANALVTFSIDSGGPGTLSGGNVSSTSCSTDANGDCTIVLTSAATGVTTVRAHTTLTVLGVSMTRNTDGTGGSSGPATKTWVDARITIGQGGTNQVGDGHTFTVLVEQNDGSGWAPAAGVDITSVANGVGGITGGTCGPSGATGADGTCTVEINSALPGSTTVTASGTVTVAGVDISVATDGYGAHDISDAKTWVDARISVVASGTNQVGGAHTFTVTVEKDSGSGFGPAQGVDVTPSISGTGGITGGSCGNAATDSNGECTIEVNSAQTGTATVDASATVHVTGAQGSADIAVATNGYGAFNISNTKTWVDGRISIAPSGTNPVGTPHTFTVTVEKDSGSGFVAAAGVNVDSVLSGVGSITGGSCTTLPTDTNGQCTVIVNSTATGTATVNASATVDVAGAVGSASVDVATNGYGAFDISNEKTWVDARITIGQSGTNQVGDGHTFTVLVEKNDGSGWAPAAGVAITSAKSGIGAITGGTCGPSGLTDADGKCTVVVNSAAPGTTSVTASGTVSLGAVDIPVATNGYGAHDISNEKTWVDAYVEITPLTATNAVGTTHTYTAHVFVSSGGAYVDAPDNTVVTFSFVGTHVGSFSAGNTCTISNGLGTCSVDTTSADPGQDTMQASTTLSVLGVTMTRTTGATAPGHANSDNAIKHWATAKIVIAPDQTNEVGQPHTFTVTLSKDTGTGSFAPASDEHVDVTLTNSNNAAYAADAAASTCDDAGLNTDQNGQCTITFTSDSAGKVKGHASATLKINGATVTVETDGTAPNSGDAVKTFVDANIQITPTTATNPLGTTHTLTGHVNVNDGSGGFANAPEGTTISFSLSSGPGTFVGPSSCATVANSGSCTVVITSSTTGTTKIRAATDVRVGGLTLHRESGDGKAGDSADATKLWASAKITIASDATNEVGQPHTFTVTLLKDIGDGKGFVAAKDERVDVTLADANGANHTAPSGTCTNAGLNTDANGQCTITFTSNSAGKVTGHASSTLKIDGTIVVVATDGVAPNSADAVKTFVDANIQITPPSAINPVGTNHTLTGHVNVNRGSGAFESAPAGTTINFTLSGAASFVGPSSCTTSGGTGSCTVVISSAVTGSSTIKAATDVTVGGVKLHRETSDTKAGDGDDASKLWADDTVRTDIVNASGGVVTSVVAGTIVHDKVFVSTAAGTPAGVPDPSGSVIFHRFGTIDCTGTATNQTVALTPGSPSTAVTDDFAPVSNMSYQADYLGDANYPAHTGACEPLTVTPVPAPAIAIVKNPKSQTVAVGGTATFTITVTNVGNTVLTNVNVVDPLSPNCNRTKADIPALASMAPGATVTYSCTRPNVRASFDNVATAIGTPPSGPNVTATDSAPVKAAPLTPAKKKIVKKKKKKTPKVVAHKAPKTTG